MASDLAPATVQEALTTRWLGRTYFYVDSIDSTNAALKEKAVTGNEQEPADGTLFLAEYQTQGRGRLERSWIAAPRSSLLFSLLFRPNWPPSRLQWLIMIASLAAAEAIEAVARLDMGIKWPNDLVVQFEGVWHKLGGILVEADLAGVGRRPPVVLGMGINMNMKRHQLPETATPATSLLVATGSPQSRLALLVELLQRLETYYEEIEQGHSPQPAWQRRLVNLGQRVEISRPGQLSPLMGTAEDTDAWGHLRVRDELGQLHVIAAGDVTLR
jgi:BirA family biotin operon repressor/biotin-[acetyl-CoA-carboxylase] ligase